MSRSNKQPIAWHESCLANSKAWLKEKEEELARTQAEVDRNREDIRKCEEQVSEAKRKGLDGFDRDRFGKTKAPSVPNASPRMTTLVPMTSTKFVETMMATARMTKMRQKMKVPHVGDKIYVETHLYIDHGKDDVVGGVATVTGVTEGISAGKKTPFVQVEEHPGNSYNWEMLAEKQAELKKWFGTAKAYADPDYTDHGPDGF